jgi:hypothetical protein
MTTKSTKTRIEGLVALGVEPAKLKSNDSIALVQGRTRIILIDQAGDATAAGKYWSTHTNLELPQGGFMSQVARREGNTEYIKLQNGKKAVTRRWTTDGEFAFTKIGDQYYSKQRRNYVVQVPVVVKGRRRDDSQYTRHSHMPIEQLGLTSQTLPMNLTPAQRASKLKEIISAQLPNGALYEVSKETWQLDPDGSWIVNEESVQFDEATGETESNVVLDRRVGVRPTMPGLLFPEGLCAEAFESADDYLCAPRQIAAVLKRDLDQVVADLMAIELLLYNTTELHTRGCTPRVVIEYAKKQELACVLLHNEKTVEIVPGNRPILAFALHEDHCYFYSCPRVRNTLMKRCNIENVKLKKAQRISTTPPAADWLKWDSKIEPGHFCCEESSLDAVRSWFLSRGREPRLILKDHIDVRSLTYNCTQRLDCCVGLLVIHLMPAHWEEIDLWVEKLNIGIAYQGQGMAGMSLKVLNHLIRTSRERVYLDGEAKAELLEKYDNKCGTCGARGTLEFDHIGRVSDSFEEQGIDAFQPMCVACHAEKTLLESRKHEDDELSSHFEKGVFDNYVMSDRAPPLVYKNKILSPFELPECEIVDVQRCRKNALFFNTHPIPVFSPLDSIVKRTSFELGDLCFVTKKYSSFITQLGYTGQGWMHRVQAEWLLHTGTIDWSCISHILTATAHLPYNLFVSPLRKMEAAWNDRQLKKQSINSLIGLWCLDEPKSYTARTSTHEGDCPPGAAKRIFHWSDGGVSGVIYDFVSTTKLIGCTSCRPLHDLCMSTEAVRVGMMIYALKNTGCQLYEFKTDSILYKPRKRKRPDLFRLSFKELHTIREMYEPALKKTRRLDQHCEMVAICSDEPVFRVEPAKETDMMKSNGKMPERKPTPAPEITPLTYIERTQVEGELVVMQGGSLFCKGIAGVGKSFFCNKLVERLRASKVKVDCCAKTHTASARLPDGCTLDHWVQRHILNGAPSCDVLYLDEISQIDVGLLALLARLTYTNMRFILAGDFHQFSPIGSCWKGTPIDDEAFQRSALLHRMCGGNVVHLTECRRADSVLFDFYSSLIDGGMRFELPVARAVAEAREIFKFEGTARWNLVISHAKRVQLNRTLNLLHSRGKEVTKLEITGQAVRGNAAQSMLIWPGIQLLGHSGRIVRNQVLYTVKKIEGEQVWLEELAKPLSFDQVKSCLRLSFSQTYASVQGNEYDEPLRLHDCTHRFFSRKHLFVGLSRSKQGAFVSLVD